MAVVGSLFAIVMVKNLFGGIGQNFANPAIAGRVILLISFSGPMTSWMIPEKAVGGFRLVSGATPLAVNALGNTADLPSCLLYTSSPPRASRPWALWRVWIRRSR